MSHLVLGSHPSSIDFHTHMQPENMLRWQHMGLKLPVSKEKVYTNMQLRIYWQLNNHMDKKCDIRTHLHHWSHGLSIEHQLAQTTPTNLALFNKIWGLTPYPNQFSTVQQNVWYQNLYLIAILYQCLLYAMGSEKKRKWG